MYSIFLKEVSSFFSSIVGYVAVLAFLVFCGFFLWIASDSSILNYGYAALDRFFELAPFMLLLLIPAVTMRSFSDEFKVGTIEWLSTKPLTSLQIILGKYFATLVLICFALLPTGIYIYTISELAVVKGNLDTGGIIGSYIGLFFLISAFSAIGVFCSAVTNNQIVAFLLSLVVCYLMFSGWQILSQMPVFAFGADYVLNLIGMNAHYDSMSRGYVDIRDVVYFLSIIILFIALTRYVLLRRTWDTANISNTSESTTKIEL